MPEQQNRTSAERLAPKTRTVSDQFQPADPKQFNEALRRFDESNSKDPNLVEVDGRPRPRELVYAEWLTAWVLRLCPQASEALHLAARCQHLCRWMVPRDSYPMTRAGYLRWREALKKFHAEKAAQILEELHYPSAMIARVQALNLKQGFPQDPETRVLEDALCLLFLERQVDELASKTSDDKMVNALRKAWNKMTPQAHTLALELPYSPRVRVLLEQALAGEKPNTPAG